MSVLIKNTPSAGNRRPIRVRIFLRRSEPMEQREAPAKEDSAHNVKIDFHRKGDDDASF